MSGNKGSGARALAEPMSLDSRTFGEGDFSHTSEQYTSNDFDTFASIEAELECMEAEEVISTEDDGIAIEQTIENETEVQDVEMAEDIQSEQIIFTSPNQAGSNVRFQTKPTLQRIPITAVQVKPNVCQPAQSQSIMIVSPAGGQGASQILKISHPANASPGQLQSLAQTLITAKSDGNIVQLRPAQTGKPLMSTGQSGNITLGSLQTVKTVPVKRQTQSGQQGRNVFTKMILSGGQQQGTGDVLIANSQGDNTNTQTFKFLSTSSGSQGITSPTKTITFAQAQQMGLITNKVQHILPSTTQKTTVRKKVCTIFFVFIFLDRFGASFWLRNLYYYYLMKNIKIGNNLFKIQSFYYATCEILFFIFWSRIKNFGSVTS